ncbi:MAG: response regulator [Spirochaetaceae bacterium]|nr:response regulator [Spirochaetaceae bacterium]
MEMEKKCLLLVEDDINVQASNKRILERRGYKVRQAYTLAQARASIGEEAPGAIILDVMLPDGNGLDFLRQLRKTSSVPVLVLTAMDTSDDVISGINAGGDSYMTKPYELNNFVTLVAELLKP